MPRAQQLILLVWLLEGLVLIGLGGLFRRLFRAPARGAEDLLLSFWTGWALLLCALEVWHIFARIDGRAVGFVAAAGAVGLVLGGIGPWRACVHGALRNSPALAAVGVSAFWLSDLSMGGPRFGDTGMYHIPMVRWIVEYPTVPGLGNLFVPLGHAQSYFLYLASLEVGPLAGRSSHLANGILVLALLARGAFGALRLIRGQDARASADLFHVLLLPPVIEQALGLFLTSPSPDLVVTLLGIVLAGQLVPFLVRNVEPGADRFHLGALTLLAGAAVTVKLSIAGLAITVPLVAASAWWRRERPGRGGGVRTLGLLAALTLAPLLPWVVRNIIQTGCPFYPGQLGALPVEWRIRADAMERIQGSMKIGLSDALRDPRWFLRRLSSLGWAEPEVVLALRLAAVAAALCVIVRLLRWRPPAPLRLSALVLLPTAASFLFCLGTTPMPRYFGATLWLLPAQLLLAGAGDLVSARRWARGALTACIAALVFSQLRAAPELLRGLDNFEAAGRTPVRPVRLQSGLVVQVPVGGADTCWDAPLPCTPEPDPRLRLRREGDLRAGFVIDTP